MASGNGTSGPDLLYGDATGNILRGRSGDDTLQGYAGDDQLFGQDGNDSLDGALDSDMIRGGNGNDTLNGGAGDDKLLGEKGDDSLDGGFDGNNQLDGGAGDDVLLGAYIGDDLMRGRDGDDLLDGRGGADRLFGDAGADMLTYRIGLSLADGGSGRDTISFANYFSSVTFRADDRSFRAGEDFTAVRGIENIIGGALGDVLSGDARANAIDGSGGRDILTGGAGDDTIQGGAGPDQMSGGSGTDFLSYAYWVPPAGASMGVLVNLGRPGAAVGAGDFDRFVGFEGLIGSAFDDTLSGGGADEIFRGGLGNDDITGGGGVDTGDYSDATGDLRISLGRTGAQATGMGSDALLGIENLIVGAGDDRLVGSDGDNDLSGNRGDDTLIGGDGDDGLNGGKGFDIADYSPHRGGLRLSLADDRSFAGPAGRDTFSSIEGLEGGRGDDVLSGDSRANLLVGNDGDDTLTGGKGSDTLAGGEGDDLLSGGSGSDWADYSEMSTRLRIDLDAGRQSNEGAGTDRFLSIENVTGGSASDRLAGDDGDNALSGGAGRDTLTGGGGNDTLIGGTGHDTLIAGSGADQRLVGGFGDDTYVLGKGEGAAVIEDSAGTADKLDASGGRGPADIDLGIGRASTSDGYTLRIAKPGYGALPVDLVFAQDLSASFADDIGNVSALIPEIARGVRDVNSASAFGAVSFGDKPLAPFGAASDHVFEVVQKVTVSSAAVGDAYAAMTIGSGGDAADAQLEALLQIAENADGAVGFRPDSQRVVVLFTDSDFHEAGDASDLRDNDGDGRLEGDPAGGFEDYPSVSQVRSALTDAGILPVFAVTEGLGDTYSDLVDRLGFGGVVSIADDSSDAVEAIRAAATIATTSLIEIAEGTRFDDVIRGNVADNELIGGAGDDTLSAGSGNDRLTGGAGADQLTGGKGSDIFVFAKAGHSEPGRRDEITDFRHGTDRINLRDIDASGDTPGKQDLDFIGEADSGGMGELFFRQEGDLKILRADLDGDGGYELEIAVHTGGFTASDFLL